MALALLLASATSLFDRDEPRFATAALEMLERGDWLVPTFRGELRADKPVLAYWLMQGGMALTGPVALGARLPAALALATTCVVAWRIAERELGDGAGWRVAAMLALAPLPLAEGTLATVDALLLLWTTLAISAGFAIVQRGPTTARVLALGLWLGLAQLTKGPVGLAVPLLSTATAAWSLRRQGGRTVLAAWKPLVAASALGLAIFLAWAIPANAATDGEFARIGLGKHVAGRSAAPMEGHGGDFFASLPFYAPVLALGFHPWFALAPVAWSWTRGTDEERAALRARLFAWVVPVFALMTLVATKLPHYVLPAWPGLCLGVGALLHEGPAHPRPRWWRPHWWLAFACALVAACALAAPVALGGERLLAPAIGIAAIQLGLATASWRPLSRGDWRAAFAPMACGSAACWVWAGLVFLPRLEAEALVPKAARLLRDEAATTAIATFGLREPSLDFALRGKDLVHLSDARQAKAWLQVAGHALLATIEGARQLDLATDPSWRDACRFVGEVEGVNFAKGRRATLQAWVKDPVPTDPGADEAPE